MGIFDRMGKVIQSNLNGLLDKAEDDKKLIELNLDEMDGQIKAGHQEVIQAIAAEKQLRKKSEELLADVERWDKRAELALKSGDEALAREALKQKKRVAAEAEQADKARSLQRDVALRAQQARAGSGAEQLGTKGSGGSAFADFRRMEEKIEGREAEGAAMAEVEEALGKGEKAEDLEAKFRDLERQTTGAGKTSDVDEELAALKKRIRI
jgi:phage shock protein A